MKDDSFIRQMTACHNPLKAFIYTLLGSSRGVDEVLQDTHVEMWLKKGSFAEGTNFFAWACRIAHFKVLEHRTALARDRVIFDDSLLEELAAESAQYHQRHSEQSSALEDCLEALPVSQRELLHERYESGRSAGELAKRLNRPAASINVTLFRIRKAVLACIERKLAAANRP